MGDRPVKGITDWQKYDLVLDVPEDVVAIVFGVMALMILLTFTST